MARRHARSAATGQPLHEYHRKRDFHRTAEPSGDRAGQRPRDDGGEPSFVVQVHDASRMHFDFRLEVDGVLKSWAVPKGPSNDPHDKRLAMPTEDHPLDYRDFEGVIPEGEYGGGPVMIWDEGGYQPLTRDRKGEPVPFAQALADGHISFALHGRKLHGAYALTRIRPRPGEKSQPWLLVKEGDEGSGDGTPDPRRVRSARTGRTLREIRAEQPRDPQDFLREHAAADAPGTDDARSARSAGDAGEPRRDTDEPPGSIPLSRPDKVLYPQDGYTKADVARHYAAAADRMLPQLAGRPLMLERHPDGLGGGTFMQKDTPAWFPPWVHRARLPKEGGTVDYPVCDNSATLVYLADQGTLTPHRWLSRADRPDRPDLLVFDLDPGDGGFDSVRTAAGRLRGLLEIELGLPTAVMTTGSRGLHVLVPLDRRADQEAVRGFARDAAALLAARHPDELTVETRKAARRGRLYLDTARNGYAQTAVAPYALRALPGAPFAAPLTWDELADPDIDPQHWKLPDLPARLAEPDPWRDAFAHPQSVTKAARGLPKR